MGFIKEAWPKNTSTLTVDSFLGKYRQHSNILFLKKNEHFSIYSQSEKSICFVLITIGVFHQGIKHQQHWSKTWDSAIVGLQPMEYQQQ